jgi:hypothetical protein
MWNVEKYSNQKVEYNDSAIHLYWLVYVTQTAYIFPHILRPHRGFRYQTLNGSFKLTQETDKQLLYSKKSWKFFK